MTDGWPLGWYVVVSGPPGSGKTTPWNDDVARPVAGGWPVIEVDTTTPVELGPLSTGIRAAAGAHSGPPR